MSSPTRRKFAQFPEAVGIPPRSPPGSIRDLDDLRIALIEPSEDSGTKPAADVSVIIHDHRAAIQPADHPVRVTNRVIGLLGHDDQLRQAQVVLSKSSATTLSVIARDSPGRPCPSRSPGPPHPTTFPPSSTIPDRRHPGSQGSFGPISPSVSECRYLPVEVIRVHSGTGRTGPPPPGSACSLGTRPHGSRDRPQRDAMPPEDVDHPE